MAELQTLEEFIKAPFGKPEIKSNEFEQKYQKLKRDHRISIAGYTTVKESYLLHIKVGSDSNPNQFYDVIFYFFTDDPKQKKSRTLRGYKVQFFSNSPSFIYQYAALYKKEGFLIESLFDKMEALYADMMPDKANATHKLSYDKSIYSACRFMEDQKISAFSKFGIILQKKKTEEQFFRDIKDFSEVKFSSSIYETQKKIDKKMKEDSNKKKEEKKKHVTKPGNGHKITATKTTGNVTINKIKPSKSTKKGKNVAKKSTRQ